MTKPGPTVTAGAGAGITVTTTAETVAAQVQVSTDRPGAVVVLEGNIDLTTGTATTAVTVQIRRGGLAGPIVANSPEVPAEGAGVRVVIPLQVSDSPGEVASQVYVLTVTQTAATGNGTINDASLQATY